VVFSPDFFFHKTVFYIYNFSVQMSKVFASKNSDLKVSAGPQAIFNGERFGAFRGIERGGRFFLLLGNLRLESWRMIIPVDGSWLLNNHPDRKCPHN